MLMSAWVELRSMRNGRGRVGSHEMRPKFRRQRGRSRVMEHRWTIRTSAVALAFGAALAGMGFNLGNAARAATVPLPPVIGNEVVLSGIAVQGPAVMGPMV